MPVAAQWYRQLSQNNTYIICQTTHNAQNLEGQVANMTKPKQYLQTQSVIQSITNMLRKIGYPDAYQKRPENQIQKAIGHKRNQKRPPELHPPLK